MTPTVGRIVHYVAFGTPGGEYAAGAHRAAMITEIYYGPGSRLPSSNTPLQISSTGVCTSVGLCIFNPTGLHWREAVPFDEAAMTPGTWHWPERED